MTQILFILISTSSLNSLLMPATPIGVVTSFSLARNEEAIFYNPANFEADENYLVNFSYNQFFLSMKSFSLTLTKKLKSRNFGIGVVNFDYGDIELRPDYPTEDSLISYSANDFSIIFCSGVRISPQGRMGINLKYISENIYVYGDYTLAFDISFSYRGPKAGVSFGATNIGSTITLNNEEVNLPARLSLGGYYDFKKIIQSFDIHYLINNGKFEFGFGFLLPLKKIIELNAAINYREAFYPGLGFAINWDRMTLKYGASIYPFNLGMINTLGIGLNF